MKKQLSVSCTSAKGLFMRNQKRIIAELENNKNIQKKYNDYFKKYRDSKCRTNSGNVHYYKGLLKKSDSKILNLHRSMHSIANWYRKRLKFPNEYSWYNKKFI